MAASSAYPHLFSPERIGALELKNRLVMAPMGSNFAEADGRCGERIQAYYEARAAGGAGLLTMGVCAVDFPSGTAEPFQVGVSSDDFVPGLQALAGRVHRHGAKIAMQLQHAGKNAVRDLAEGRPLLVPSPPPRQHSDMMAALTREELAAFVGASRPKGGGPVLKVMEREDIERLIDRFAAAAARARLAGFDGVEIHAGHNYLLAGFLSAYYNRREDEYGGSLENRARLLVDTLRAVRARVGADFPVWLRLDGEEVRTPGGIGIEDAKAVARLAVAAGAQAVNVSAYAALVKGVAFTEAPLVHEPGGFLRYARAIKAAVEVPVIVAGRLDPERAEHALAAGDADFIALARPLLADPELPNKLSAGRPQDVRPCIYCYTCVSQIFVNQRVKCAVNPLTGHEADSQMEPAATPRHVVVVGGGPAGMEAARVAALRGHRVTLLERSGRLGGTLFFAALAYPENGRLLDWLREQVRSLPIELRLDCAADAATVAALKPDVIVVASGARRPAGHFPGADLSHVWSGDELRRLMTGDGADEIARRKLSLVQRGLFKAGGLIGATDSTDAIQALSRLWMPLGQRVVIVGGGLVGLELGEFLVARGRQVSILEPTDRFGRELAIVRRWRVLDALQSHGAELIPEATVVEVTAKDVVVRVGPDGEPRRLAADSVVLASGAEADPGVADRLAGLGVPIHVAGDCAGIGYIEGAMRAGNEIGCQV